MVFDTETTGLLKKHEMSKQNITPKRHSSLKSIFDFNAPVKYPVVYKTLQSLDKQPYIAQLSFVVLNKENDLVFHYDKLIRLPEGVEVEKEATAVSGITAAMCKEKGVDVCDALKTFVSWFLKCERVVAHNIDFDRTLIRFEMARNYEQLQTEMPYCNVVFEESYDRIAKIDYYDTMRRGFNVCGATRTLDSGKKIPKPPSLKELYSLFFGKTPEPMHNSIVDVLVTMRCYLKLSLHRDIDDNYFMTLVGNAVKNESINGHLQEFL
jgi:DNA polymerase III epsilon subunit-like protein